MSTFKDEDSLWGILESPSKTKRKTKTKKNKKRPTTELDKQVPKKKKKDSKFKEEMKKKKKKAKRKKKSKNRSSVEQDDSFVVTQSSDGEAKTAAEHKTVNPLSKDELQHEQLTGELKKKVSRKKKVAFDLTSGCIPAKRLKFSSPSQPPPRESLLLESESVRGGETCSQVTVIEHSQTQHNDSQCTSDDINSQDLFITQKTFRAPPSLPSSDEAINKIITPTPAVAQMEQHHDDSFEDALFHQHHRESTEHVQEPKTERLPFTGEKKEDRIMRKGQKQGKADLCPIKPRRVNPFLDDPIIVPHPSEVTELQNDSSSSSKLPLHPQPLVVSLTSAFTQTENFFTTELCSFLKFGQKVREAVHSEDLQPLDLSLPLRARKDLRKIFSDEIRSDNPKKPHPSCFSDRDEDLTEPVGQCCSVNIKDKRERSASSQSESDNKSADVTISSDSESSCRAIKLDLVQVTLHTTSSSDRAERFT